MILPKFESHHLDLHIWSYKIHKTAFKTGNLNYPFEYTVTVRGVHLSAGPHVSDKKNRGCGCDGAVVAKLTNGGFSDDEEGTSVTVTTSRID